MVGTKCGVIHQTQSPQPGQLTQDLGHTGQIAAVEVQECQVGKFRENFPRLGVKVLGEKLYRVQVRKTLKAFGDVLCGTRQNPQVCEGGQVPVTSHRGVHQRETPQVCEAPQRTQIERQPRQTERPVCAVDVALIGKCVDADAQKLKPLCQARQGILENGARRRTQPQPNVCI